jgi:hypothetical protein
MFWRKQLVLHDLDHTVSQPELRMYRVHFKFSLLHSEFEVSVVSNINMMCELCLQGWCFSKAASPLQFMLKL